MDDLYRQPFEVNESKESALGQGMSARAFHEIKQEPFKKEEPFDAGNNIMMMSFSHSSHWPVDNLAKIGSGTIGAPNESKSKSRSSSASQEGGVVKANAAFESIVSSGEVTPFSIEADRKYYKCLECGYKTLDKTKLTVHTRKHTGERPFPCTNCSKRFLRKDHLQRHMRTHVSEFLFSCSNCLQGFSEFIDKLNHEAACTVHRYNCNVCKKYSTLVKTHLDQHLLSHTGKREFQCSQCSMKFKRQGALTRHMQTHINVSPVKFKFPHTSRASFSK